MVIVGHIVRGGVLEPWDLNTRTCTRPPIISKSFLSGCDGALRAWSPSDMISAGHTVGIVLSGVSGIMLHACRVHEVNKGPKNAR